MGIGSQLLVQVIFQRVIQRADGVQQISVPYTAISGSDLGRLHIDQLFLHQRIHIFLHRIAAHTHRFSDSAVAGIALVGLPVLPEHQIGIHRDLSRIHPQIKNLLRHREEIPGTIPLAAHRLVFPFIQSMNLSLGTTRRLPTCKVGKLFSCISS